jgi:oxalate decarboxylase/phosphoglucose isomerase-like protein (cupin superfamily)
MTDSRVAIAALIAPAADLSARAGLPLTLRAGRIRHGADVLAEEDLVRRLADMRDVLADGVGRRGRRVEYHMLNGVRHREDAHLADLPLRYELTALAGRPIGWEAAKTLGHVHVCPPGGSMGYPEVVEVVHGEAGFLIQDLADGPQGPQARQAWLVRARPGDWVVLPPDLAHVTIDLGAGPLVFSDVIDRRARGIYGGVAAAHGFGWYVAADGALRPNPSYTQPPHLEEVSAADWSGAAPAPLYRHFQADLAQLAWLSEPDAFREVAPDVAARIADALD